MSASVRELVRELQALVQTGLHYTQDRYDKQRYQRLRTISFQLMEAMSASSAADFEAFFLPETGYATPKVDLRACVMREGQVLLVQERSDGRWTLPGGWADQNESPSEGIAREVEEESGFTVEVGALYALKDRARHDYEPTYPFSIYKLFFTASIVGGAAQPGQETQDVQFFDPDDLPALSVGRTLPEDILQGCAHHRRGHDTSPQVD